MPCVGQIQAARNWKRPSPGTHARPGSHEGDETGQRAGELESHAISGKMRILGPVNGWRPRLLEPLVVQSLDLDQGGLPRLIEVGIGSTLLGVRLASHDCWMGWGAFGVFQHIFATNQDAARAVELATKLAWQDVGSTKKRELQAAGLLPGSSVQLLPRRERRWGRFARVLEIYDGVHRLYLVEERGVRLLDIAATTYGDAAAAAGIIAAERTANLQPGPGSPSDKQRA